MIEIILVIVFQIIFNFSRTIGTRHLARDNVTPTLIWGTVIQISWLVTTSLGVKAVFESNWIVLISYLVGGTVGSYLAMKIKIKE